MSWFCAVIYFYSQFETTRRRAFGHECEDEEGERQVMCL
jgi:hypothetical protein